ncbi:MAG: hypothetical protein ACPL68_05340, partial [Candidatus Hydrothermia bacterium]
TAIDLTTGQEVSQFSVVSLATTGQNAGAENKAGGVLWDQTHGIYLDYRLNGWFSILRDTLIGRGYAPETTVAGVNNIDLSPYRVIVLCLGSAWNSAYSSAEADSLVAFVNRGGSLVIMGDNTGCPNPNLNPVLSRFNMAAGVGTPGDCITSTTANPIYAPIFSGVSSACGAATGTISASSPSEVIAWSLASPLMAGRCDDNKGGVFLVGDINIWDNSYIYNYNNMTLMINVFVWASAPPCRPTGSLEPPGPGPSLRVAPNPVKDLLSLSLPSGFENATLYNAVGVPVAKLYAGNNDLRELPEGVYLLRVGEQTRRVVKVR